MLATDNFVNGGITAAAVLAILLVPLSTFGRRWRHPAVRFLAWSTSIVFLPLTSSVIFSLLDRTSPELTKQCGGPAQPTGKDNPYIQDMWTLLLWVVLILTIKTNVDADAAVAVASTDGGHVSVGDGQRIRPPIENLAQYAWVAFLIWLCVPRAGWLGRFHIAVFIAFTALGLVKMALKLAAFRNASNSFALGKNTSLIAGHMAQLVTDGGGANGGRVPRYIVMGETERHVEESTHGYRIKRDVLEDKFSSLVTLDRVWLLADHGDGILARRQELRDLCLSYSLFKILRRRLSGYPLADAGSGEALTFVLRGMDSASAGVNADRMFRVMADELWFASDFYYTRTPLCILGGWLATLSYLCSILIIVGAIAVAWFYEVMDVVHTTPYKVITFYLLHAVVFVEIWEIAAGVRSKWTKMALLGHYIRHESAWRRSSFVHAVLRAVLRVRKPRRWRHEMGQNSVLEPRRFLRWTGRMRSVEVSPAVRDAVVRSLLSTYGRMSNGGVVARRVGGKIDWSLDGDGGSTTELILTWHVATRLFEMRVTSASADMIAACQLSYYCAYLVAAAPELLPDSVAWTEKRYREVSADVRAALGKDGGSSESAAGRYGRVMEALSAVSRDIVLQRGAELGRHLVEQHGEDEASACRILADFWSEMVLYVAPSENVKGHVQAMARGGEFITLVWALLLHAGVTTRPETRDGSIP
ncbi:hypothetical protein HU200_039634 [Digitaria exilis]|uniref:DUF4220 domain-containing protein n=1 Tax=Digitaria exilis TaxID=1010633 RepID=A0A835B870_9POAL|nr:hypothetical protein HU200_039634 [Digitaria exilis]CAB3473074.1 unnamed protein product [Digitaria exilis]